jgi:predicted O-methyltransferase YrrM
MKVTEVRSLLDDLSTSEPLFHGWAPEVEVSWGLNGAALDLLVDLAAEGDRTLETGVGYSTVVFAARGCEHTVVSPMALEHDRVRTWCIDRGIDLSAVRFLAAPSQEALPALEPSALDLVLIDGDHAFPSPFIDFYYAAGRLVEGGLLMVDDTHLRTGRVLAEFLRVDAPRWRVHTELATTTVFERLSGPLIPPEGWLMQPWGAEMLPAGPPARWWERVRHSVRLRTRLRVVLGRDRSR